MTLALTGGTPPETGNRGFAKVRRNEAALLVLPALIPVLLLSILPIFLGLAFAFTDSKLISVGLPRFVGITNFAEVFRNGPFWQSFGIGAVWTVSVTVFQVVLGMALALLLNTNLRFRSFVRVLAIVPWAMPPVIVAIMWQQIYSPNHGPLNWIIHAFGGPAQINWLGSFGLALPAVIVVGVWTGIPQNTIALLAGLQQVPSELSEAAMMDGANSWSRFTHITLPFLRPVMIAIASLSFIWNFNSFGIVFVMTGGGPGGRTLLPMLFVYTEAFENGNTGVAAAMTVVIVVILLLIITAALLFQLRRRVED